LSNKETIKDSNITAKYMTGRKYHNSYTEIISMKTKCIEMPNNVDSIGLVT